MSRNRDELKKGLPKLESMLIDFLLDSGIGPKHIKGNVVLQYAPKIQELCDSITKIRQTALKEIDGSSEKPNNHFYGIGAIRNGVQEKIDWFRSRPYFDEKSDYSKGFLDALVEMRSLVNRPDFDNPEGLDEAAKIGGEKEYPIIPELTDDGKDLHAHKQVAFRKGFKVGAEWQKEQDDKELSEKIAAAYQLGLADKEKQMLKKAVEGDIGMTLHDKRADLYVRSKGYLPESLGIKCNDKVRIIIVKED